MNVRRHRGFSLVELLVVIAIVALLMSVLLPALGKTRQLVEMTTCSSNQRQVGISLADYGANWNQFPAPFGQQGYNATYGNYRTAPTPFLAPPNNYIGYGTPTWYYMFGYQIWWIGSVTRDTRFYDRKEFMCTAKLPKVANIANWQMRFDGTDSYTFGSTFGGTMYMNSNAAENISRPYYVYFHPLTFSTNITDWWSYGYASTDALKLVFGSPNWYRQYQMAPNDGAGYPVLHGPRLYEVGPRRAQLMCPSACSYDALNYAGTMYEPHGNQTIGGTDSTRATKDPEVRNFLFTDGSVTPVNRP